MSGRIRVLVVDDSLTVRGRIREVIEGDSENALEIVGEATDGKAAIEQCRVLRPDVITMDMMLPEMSGLAATEYIMAHFPVPILVVSSSFNRGELYKTYEALAAGAVDVLDKPSGTERDGEWEARFLAAVKLVAKIRVITHPRARLAARPSPSLVASAPSSPLARAVAAGSAVVGIGTSTGGPAAIVDVLRHLPPSFTTPIVLVLHIGEAFAKPFADWLDSQTERRVSYAADGDVVAHASGRVLMAPPGKHLTITAGRAHLSLAPPRFSCRPSVDVLFESLALDYGPACAGVLLTGMGKDGAGGLLAIRRAGGRTIAQDEASSVVYGMPREAALLGAAEIVLPLSDVGAALVTLTGARSTP